MKRLTAVVAALVLLTALAGCWQTKHAWHQKLTLVVETPTGEVSGSAVVGITAWFGQLPASASEVEYDVIGEATMVEIAPGKYLFALLGDPSEYFHHAARERFEGMTRQEWLYEIPKQSEPVELFPGHMPMLVTFEDVTKPETVKLVDPLDLAASFGPGVSLKVVTLEITDEAVTNGRVEVVLGSNFFSTWAERHQQEIAKGNINANPYFKLLTSNMNRDRFIRGDMQ